MNKKNCRVDSKKIGCCCRYNYTIIKNSTINDVLCHNEWVFNDSWNFWAYCDHMDAIKMSDIAVDPIVEDKYILFSSLFHEFEDWKNIINWEDYGAWYAYNFPTQKFKIKEVLLLGVEWDLPIENPTNSPLTDYFSLGEEWQFIHNIRPDIFLIKQGQDVVVGSPDFSAVWAIDRNMR